MAQNVWIVNRGGYVKKRSWPIWRKLEVTNIPDEERLFLSQIKG